MSKQQINAIVQESQKPAKHGKWSRFCVEHQLSKDAVFHWRKKLGLGVRVTALSLLAGCATRTVPVETVRTVVKTVPGPVQKIPAALTEPCPAQPVDMKVGQSMDWLQQCVQLLDSDRKKIRELP